MKPILILIALFLAIAPLPSMTLEACAGISCCCAEPRPEPVSCCSQEPAAPTTPCTCQLHPFTPGDEPIVGTAPCLPRDPAPTVAQPQQAPVACIPTLATVRAASPTGPTALRHSGLSPPFEGPRYLSLSVLRR